MMVRRTGVMILAAALLCACQSDLPVDIPGLTPRIDDKTAVRSVLDDVQRGMESRRIYQVLAHVSLGYADAEGRNYQAIQVYLNDLFKRYKDIRITRTPPLITVQGDRALAVETFGTIGTPYNVDNDRPINTNGRLNVYLRKEEGAWKIIEWGRLQ